jgi:hypothetical protein
MSNINLQDRIRQMQRGRTQSNLGGGMRPMDANPMHTIPTARPMDANPWRTQAPTPQPMDANPWRTAQATTQPAARPMDANPWRSIAAQPSAQPMDATPWRTQAPNPANAVGGPGQTLPSSMGNPNLAQMGGGQQFASSMSGAAQPLDQQQMMQHDMAQRAENPQIRGALPTGTNINPMAQLAATAQSGQPKQAMPPKYGSNEHINAFAQQAMQQGFDPATIAQFIKGRLLQQ